MNRNDIGERNLTAIVVLLVVGGVVAISMQIRGCAQQNWSGEEAQRTVRQKVAAAAQEATEKARYQALESCFEHPQPGQRPADCKDAVPSPGTFNW